MRNGGRGSLATHQDRRRVGNQGSVRLIVENVEYPDEYFGVIPGQVEVPVPFELARVMAAHDLEAQLMVLGPDHRGDGGSPEPSSGDTPVVHLDHGTAHYAVPQALCGPRLRYGPGNPLPTSSHIASAFALVGIPVDLPRGRRPHRLPAGQAGRPSRDRPQGRSRVEARGTGDAPSRRLTASATASRTRTRGA